jgi:hypothetical protein
VGILVGHCDQPEQAGYVDDVAVPGRDHVGQKGFGPIDDAPKVDVHDPLDVLELRPLEVAVVGDAGIVVDLVDFAEMGHNRVGVGQNGLPLGDVEPVGFHGRAECFGLTDGFGESFGVDVRERELCALRREIDGQGSADAGSGSGDDGDFAFESVHFTATFTLLVRISDDD